MSRNRRATRLLGLIVASFSVGACFTGPSIAFAQDDPVKKGREAFTSQGDWDWYDSGSDSVRPLTPPRIPANKKPQKNSGNGSGSGSGGSGGTGSGGSGSGSGGGGSQGIEIPQGGSGMFSGFGFIANSIFWVVLVVAIVAVVAGIVWAVMKMDFSKDDDEEEEVEEREEVELSPAEKLPFRVDPSIGNFLDAAKAAYQSEDYNKAVVYLFSHTLLTLDQNQWIRLTRGKTNRQYLGEIRGNSELKKFFESVMLPFESAFFGNLKVTKNELDSCWSQADRFHQIVARPMPTPGQFPHMQPAIS